MIKAFKILSWFLSIVFSKTLFAAVPTDLITAMTDTFPGTKKNGEYVELVPETVWAWVPKSTDPQRFAPIPVVKYQGQYFYNNNERSTKLWVNLENERKEPEPEQFIQENIFVWMRDHAPIIEIGKVKDSTPIVYSAIECPACFELEGKLNKGKKAYRILPSSLKTDPSLEYRSIVCAVNKPKSWVKAMTTRKIDKPASSDCKDPLGIVQVWAILGNAGAYPSAYIQGRPPVVGSTEVFKIFSAK